MDKRALKILVKIFGADDNPKERQQKVFLPSKNVNFSNASSEYAQYDRHLRLVLAIKQYLFRKLIILLNMLLLYIKLGC